MRLGASHEAGALVAPRRVFWEVGHVYFSGYSDTDADFVPDVSDRCPDEFGLEPFEGLTRARRVQSGQC